MNILWISEVDPDPDSGAGGTELRLVEGLRRLGHAVHAVWAADLPRLIRHGNLHYALELSRTYARAMTACCRKSHYDVVTFNLGQGYRGSGILKREGFPGVIIGRSHGLEDHWNEVMKEWRTRLEFPSRPWWKRWFSRYMEHMTCQHLDLAARWSDGYVVSNSLDAEYLHRRHGMPRERIACIAQAPAPVFLKTRAPEMSVDRLYRMLYVAGYHPAKAPKTVAAAAEQLVRKHSKAEMTWVCRQQDHDRIRALFTPEVAGRIHLKSWMSQAELVKEFDTHGIFFYPTLFDGFGKVFLEAMCRGMCVLGTRAGGMVDLIQDGRNGFLHEFNRADQLRETTLKLWKNQDEASTISCAAALTARKFSWERASCQLESFARARIMDKTNSFG